MGAMLYALTQLAEKAAVQQATTELRAGAAVARKTLEFRGQQLANAAHILTADFGLKEAVASGDRATLLSALANHSARIKADVAAVFDIDGHLLVTTPGESSAAAAETLKGAVDAQSGGIIYRVIDGTAYQLVAATVRAPEPIASVVMGFALNANLAREIAHVVAVDVEFVSWDGSRFDSIVSTSAQMGDLQNELTAPRKAAHVVAARHEKMLAQHEALPIDKGELDIVLHSPLDVAAQAYWKLRNAILFVGGGVLLIAAFAGALLARAATKPIAALTAAAERIERGDYSSAHASSDALEFRKLSAAFTAMRDAVAEREQRILHHAHHDELTGLVNRKRIHQLIADRIAQQSPQPLTLCLLDIIQFSDINASLGHSLGDQLLIELAQRLTTTAPHDAIVAHVGLDQFLILLPQCDLESGILLANDLLGCILQPIDANGISIRLRARGGLASYPMHGTTAEDLMRRVDVALFSAHRNVSAVAAFAPEAEQAHRRRIQVLGDLQHGIESNQLRLVYQPKLDMRTQTLTSCEVLVRWRHPVHGEVPPSEFIPHAERTGSIRRLTSWILQNVAMQLSAWNAAGYRLEAAVNISAADIADPGLATEVEQLLQHHAIHGEQLTFEITETVAMRDIEVAVRAMERLRRLGIRFAIDDFGTGYSSLAQLSRLPANELKLDGGLIARLTEDDRARVVVRAMVELGHSLDLRIVAEGVENLQLMREIAKLGCDVAQGYVIAKPLPPDALPVWLATRRLARVASMDSTMAITAMVRSLAAGG